MPEFSEQLVEKTQVYFKRRYGISLSKEKACVWLESYARLFLMFSETSGAGGRAAPAALAAEATAPDLIYVPLNKK